MIKRRIRKIERDEKCWLTSAKGIGSQWDSARSQAAQWDSDRSQLNNFKPLATAHFGAAALAVKTSVSSFIESRILLESQGKI
ncbi:hypothetical protein ACOSQ3_028925 [Xanthoceras sorbifolium]